MLSMNTNITKGLQLILIPLVLNPIFDFGFVFLLYINTYYVRFSTNVVHIT